MKSLREKIKEFREDEIKERIKEGQVYHGGLWWKNQEEYEKMVRYDFGRLDKTSNNYDRDVKGLVTYYGIQKRDIIKYL